MRYEVYTRPRWGDSIDRVVTLSSYRVFVTADGPEEAKRMAASRLLTAKPRPDLQRAMDKRDAKRVTA